MISPPPSPILSATRFSPGKPRTENENLALSPKRSFAQHDEDHLSQLEAKRRHVRPDAQPRAPRRAPLDPLSASDLENRRTRDHLQTIPSSSHHSLVSSSSLPDLRSLQPGLPVGSKSCDKPSSAVPGDSVCSWPPPVSTPPADRSSHSNHVGQHASPSGSLHCSEGRSMSRATFSEPTSTWCPLNALDIRPMTTMAQPPRTAGWKTDNVLQPIKSRTCSVPSVRRPPGDLWRSDSEPGRTSHGVASAASPSSYSTSPLTPPGLPPHRPEARQSGSDRDLTPRRSISLSLAPGTQPVLASEPMKSVPPIGAERSRVVSMTPLKPQPRSSKPISAYTPDPNDPSPHPWCTSLLSPRLQAKWKDFLLSSDATLREKPVESSGHVKVSKEEFERLLRHATGNKYATKVISPLSPLRTSSPTFSMSTDPAYQLRMPSLSNNPSPRYAKCPPRRTRTLCDSYQSHNFDVTCVHCQECKRDTVGKRLLAFRFRQLQSHVQRRGHYAFSARTMTMPVIEDRLLLADCERDVFVFEGDEEGKTLWDEVVAATSTGSLPFSRTGSSCAVVVVNGRSPPATPHLRDLHDFDDGIEDEYPEIPDEDFLTNESATLFREVSVC